jgi:hypothetical protein
MIPKLPVAGRVGNPPVTFGGSRPRFKARFRRIDFLGPACPEADSTIRALISIDPSLSVIREPPREHTFVTD